MFYQLSRPINCDCYCWYLNIQ